MKLLEPLQTAKSYQEVAQAGLKFADIKAVRPVAQRLYELLVLSFLGGRADMARQVEKFEDFDPYSVPFDEAIEYFKDKLVVLPEEYRGIEARFRSLVFSSQTVRGLDAGLQYHILNTLKRELEEAIEQGQSYEGFKKRRAHIWWFDRPRGRRHETHFSAERSRFVRYGSMATTLRPQRRSGEHRILNGR